MLTLNLTVPGVLEAAPNTGSRVLLVIRRVCQSTPHKFSSLGRDIAVDLHRGLFAKDEKTKGRCQTFKVLLRSFYQIYKPLPSYLFSVSLKHASSNKQNR